MSGYKKIAEGLKAMAEGFEALANEEAQAPMQEAPVPETKEEAPAPKAEKKTAKKAKAEPKEELAAEDKGSEEALSEEEAERRKVLAVKGTYSEADIRAAVHFVNMRGHLDEVKKIFKALGATNISSLKEEHYAEAMEKVREIDAGDTQ